LGFHNVEFRKGKIQDLRLDLDRFEQYLAENPVRSSNDWLRAEEHAHGLRATAPMIVDGSVDVVVSICVLNLVRSDDRRQLFAELFRVLKPGGRAVISDIVSSDDVTIELQADPKLWSGCISGAFREDRFLQAFESAGFQRVEVLERQAEAWTTVGTLEFRSLTVRAFKPPADAGTASRTISSGLAFVTLDVAPAASECCSPGSKCC
jgi:SAM-dependent methyltransferase